MAKVAIFLPLLGGGGAERVMVNLSYGLIDAGHTVDLVLAKNTGDYLHLVPPAVNVIDLGGYRVLASVRPLARYLRQHQPDVLFSTLDHANLVALWAKWWARWRGQITLRVASTLSVQIASREYPQDRWLRYLIPIFYRFADAVIANSHAAADDAARVARLPRERIGVVYNPSVTPALLERRTASPTHPFLVDKDRPVILGVGRLTTTKDFATLIRAFAQVRADTPSRLLILGRGPEQGALQALAESLGVADDVDLPGFAENPYAVMSQSDVFVLPSRYEGLPNVLIEAMACGCPPVATDSPGGSAEVLGGGRYGLLVPVGDVDALAGAIRAQLEAPTPAHLLRQRAADFTLDATLSGYLHALGLVQPAAPG